MSSSEVTYEGIRKYSERDLPLLTPNQKTSFCQRTLLCFSEKGLQNIRDELEPSYGEIFFPPLLSGVTSSQDSLRFHALIEKVTKCRCENFPMMQCLSEKRAWFYFDPIRFVDPSKQMLEQMKKLNASALRIFMLYSSVDEGGQIPVFQGALDQFLSFAKSYDSLVFFTQKSLEMKTPSRELKPSTFFDEKKPFESIAQFTDNFAALSFLEQSKLFISIWNFFSRLALDDQIVEIPKEFEKRFRETDILFLLDFCSEIKDRHQFVMTVELACKIRLDHLPISDQVVMIQIKDREGICGGYWFRKEWEGLEKMETLKLDLKTAIALMKHQYPNFLEKELFGVGATRESIRLLVLSKKWQSVNLSDSIIQWIEKQKKTEEFTKALESMLAEEDVFKVLDTCKLGPFTLNVLNMSDQAVFHNLKINFQHYNTYTIAQIIELSIGTNSPRIAPLGKFRKEAFKEKEEIDRYLSSFFSKQIPDETPKKITTVAKKAFEIVLKSAREIRFFEYELDVLIQDEKLTKYEYEKLINLIKSEKISEIFSHIEMEKSQEKLISSIESYFENIDVIKDKKENLEELHSLITSRYTKSWERIVMFFLLHFLKFSSREQIRIIVDKGLEYQLDVFWKTPFKMPIEMGRSFLFLLEDESVKKFLVANGFSEIARLELVDVLTYYINFYETRLTLTFIQKTAERGEERWKDLLSNFRQIDSDHWRESESEIVDQILKVEGFFSELMLWQETLEEEVPLKPYQYLKKIVSSLKSNEIYVNELNGNQEVSFNSNEMDLEALKSNLLSLSKVLAEKSLAGLQISLENMNRSSFF